MLNCLMYKLIYYRFGEMRGRGDKPAGYDSVRKAEIGNKDFKLTYFEEAYTSSRWLLRVYKVLPPAEMAPEMVSRHEPVSKAVPKLPKMEALPAF